MSQPDIAQILGASDREVVLAEDFAHVLDSISRVIGYAEDGNWRSLHEKIGTLQSSLNTFERKISSRTGDPDDPTVYRAPDVDAKRTVQLITAYAQQYGGRLGPVLFPLDKLENPEAVALIQEKAERNRRFREELFGNDERGA
ncbi:hypothetical protein AB0G49_13750 [Streptomyces longwoodensis]|uniref:hypothetical protein n=1 Tax=Streptomyces longwoodensis TaxID=68231 RepID=UPI0033E87ECA